nr:putative uncharacterized protein DDB_G0271606 [Arachis hypogaea]
MAEDTGKSSRLGHPSTILRLCNRAGVLFEDADIDWEQQQEQYLKQQEQYLKAQEQQEHWQQQMMEKQENFQLKMLDQQREFQAITFDWQREQSAHSQESFNRLSLQQAKQGEYIQNLYQWKNIYHTIGEHRNLDRMEYDIETQAKLDYVVSGMPILNQEIKPYVQCQELVDNQRAKAKKNTAHMQQGLKDAGLWGQMNLITQQLSRMQVSAVNTQNAPQEAPFDMTGSYMKDENYDYAQSSSEHNNHNNRQFQSHQQQPSQQTNSQPQKNTGLEAVLNNFMQETRASLRKLEVQVGQLSKQIPERPPSTFPGDTVVNPREDYKAIQLRSAKVPGSETKVNKELVEKEAPEEKKEEVEHDPPRHADNPFPVVFNVFEAIKYPNDSEGCMRVDVVEPLIQEVLEAEVLDDILDLL